MHTIRLDVQDSVLDKVLYFLQNLPKNEVKIIEDIATSKSAKVQKLSSISLHTKGFKFNREEANER